MLCFDNEGTLATNLRWGEFKRCTDMHANYRRLQSNLQQKTYGSNDDLGSSRETFWES